MAILLKCRDKREWDVVGEVKRLWLIEKQHQYNAQPEEHFTSKSALLWLMRSVQNVSIRAFMDDPDYRPYCERALRRYRRKTNPFRAGLFFS